jgi:hypothetical protein
MRLLALLVLALLSACQCGGVASVVQPRADAGGADAGSPPITDAGLDGGVDAGAPACVDGDPCGAGGVCAGGACCPAEFACGPSCCPGGTVCSFLRCVTPGAPCRDTSECPAGDFCDLAGSRPGVRDGGTCASAPTPGQCITEPPRCAPDAGPGDLGRRCIEPCRFTRSAQSFQPVVKYAWGNATLPTDTDVMMAPIVTQLTDDDCDGRITARDTPEIVVVTFTGGAYTQVGTVRALTVRGGALVQLWQRPGVIFAGSQLTSGNIDGQPGNEIVGCGPDGPVALRADGSVLWNAGQPVRACNALSLADLDGDGAVEVVSEAQVLDGRTGAVRTTFPFSSNTVVADVDGDGSQDVVTASAVVRPDGGTVASVAGPAGYVAVGDLNRDGRPEVVSVNTNLHTLAVWSFDPAAPTRGTLLRSDIDINGPLSPSLCPMGSTGRTKGGGPLTLGDFNADGFPDVALAGGVGYAVFDGKKLMDGTTPAAQTLLWIRQTRDCSSASTGSTLFDFDGDGRVEVVYGDEVDLHVYDSATGSELLTTCNTSGTLVEYPVVADVDNDGQADLIVVANAYAYACPQAPSTRFSGVRVFGSRTNDWVVTRTVWNQHAYSVTNIEEDGTVPRAPPRNWTVPGLNNFRQNKQPGLEFSAADAVVSVSGLCGLSGIDYRVTVRNVGEAPLPPGVRVELIANPATAPQALASFSTSRSLGPTQAETFAWTAPASVGTAPVVARVDAGAARECRIDNNTSTPPTVACIN